MVQKFISIKDGRIVIDFPAYIEEEEIRTFSLECIDEWFLNEYLNG